MAKNNAYPGDLRRDHAEPDTHYWCRWVSTVPEHPDEPWQLKPFRKMHSEAPVKFFDIFQKARAQWDKDCREAGLAEPEAQESKEPCDVLVKQLLDEWEKVK